MAELKGGGTAELKTLQNVQYSHSNQAVVAGHVRGRA